VMTAEIIGPAATSMSCDLDQPRLRPAATGFASSPMAATLRAPNSGAMR